jgi:hypothetical protein
MDDLSQVPTERLEADLVAHAAVESAGLATVLRVLREFDSRQAWGSWECRSAAHWMAWKCGLSLPAGIERVRVAHALANLPLVDAAFAEGKLSYSKVRAITRVATADDEETWVSIGEYGTAAQLDRLASAFRKVNRQDALDQIASTGLSWSTLNDGSIEFTLRLPAETATAVIKGLDQEVELVMGAKRSVLLAEAATRLLSGVATVQAGVVVHLHDDHAYVEDGPSIHPDLAEALACDGPVSTVIDTPHGPVIKDRRTAPTKTQRKWLATRHPQCQIQGCHHTGHFHAHHVVERRQGGKTVLTNLIRVCAFHHRMIHLHRLLLVLHPDRTLEVFRSDGTPIDKDLTMTQWMQAPVDDPNRITGKWCGDTLSIPDCFDALGVGWPSASRGKSATDADATAVGV